MNPHRTSPRPHLPRLAYLVSALLLLSLLGWAGIPAPAAPSAPTLTLHSPVPGELHLTWPAPTPPPLEYHIQYAPTDTPLLIEHATAATNALTLYELEPGVVYTVHVRAGTGPWSVPVLQRIDDYRADPETVGTIGVGASEEGYIESAGDADWFFVDLAAGEGYPIAVTGAPAPSLAVYDATGAVVQQGLVWHQAGALTFTPATAGLYHLAVGGPAAEPGRYTLTVAEPPTAKPRRSRTLAGAEPADPPAPRSPTAVPDQPRGLEATATHGRVVLTWNDPQDESITGYVILRRVRVNNTGGDFSVLVSDTGTAALTYTDATVAASLTYTYRIKAINAHGVSERSRWVHIDTPAAPTLEEEQAADPPDQPRGLEATATHDSVTLTWDDPGDDSITGYVILRRIPAVDPQGQFNELVSNTGTDATTYTDGTVSAETRYTYRIKAINEHGVSERSRWSHINVPAAPEPEEEQAAEPPARPTGLASAAASDLVLLSWADPGDDSVTGYRILRADVVDGVQGEFAVLIEDTGTAETSYADDTVENGRVYVYRVLAIGPGGLSEPSRDVRVRTTAPVPPPNRPRGLPSQNTSQPRQSVSEPSGDDFPDDGTTTGRLEVNGSVTGNIDSNGDADAFAIELVQGRTYRFNLEGSETEQGTLADPRIVYIFLVLGPGDISFLVGSTDEDSGKGENSRLEFTLGSSPDATPYLTGTYYIVVEEHGDNDTGTYRLSMEQVAGSGFGRTMTVEGNLQPGDSLSGTLGVPTHHGIFSYYFALEDLEVGRYTVDFGTGGINSIHTFLTDRGPDLDDTWIIVDQAHGRRSFTFDVRPNMEGTYYALLTVRKDDPGDYTATLEKAMPHLSVGGSVRGDLPSSSNDPEATLYGFVAYMEFFSVDLRAGRTYRLDIEGKDTCRDCTMDYTMLNQVQAPDGSFAGRDGNFDDSDGVAGNNNLFVYGGGEGRNTRFIFTADQDGTHFLKVGGRLFRISSAYGASSRFRAGTFKVSIREER